MRRLLAITLSLLLALTVCAQSHGTPIKAGTTTVMADAIQDIELVPGTPFNPTNDSILLADVTARGWYSLDRAEQAGFLIPILEVESVFIGFHPLVGPFELGNGAAHGIGTGSGVILSVIQDPNDPGFPTGEPSSFLSGDLAVSATFGLRITGGPAAGAELFTKDPVTFAGVFDGLPPSVGTTVVSPGAIDIFTANPMGGPDLLVAVSTNRRIATIPEPSAFTLAGVGLIGLAFAWRYRRRRRFA